MMLTCFACMPFSHQTGRFADVDTGKAPNVDEKTPLESILDIIRSMFPSNLVKAAVEMNVVGIISFSIGMWCMAE